MNCINDDHDSTCTISQLYATNFSQALHTYSVEWNEHRLIWRIDNNIVLQRTRFYNTNGVEKELCGSITNQNWFRDLIYPKDDIPMWIITGFGVLDDSPADFPVDMEIEWIRVYQQIDSNGSVEICSSSDILGSTVAGQEITVGGPTCSSITIADGEFLNLVAVDGITLDSNFKVETGAIFSMKIDP